MNPSYFIMPFYFIGTPWFLMFWSKGEDLHHHIKNQESHHKIFGVLNQPDYSSAQSTHALTQFTTSQLSWLNTVPAQPTAEDEVGVEDAQGGLVGTLLVIDCGWDDEAKWDAGDALQHDQNDDQHQGAFIRHLQRERERMVG